MSIMEIFNILPSMDSMINIFLVLLILVVIWILFRFILRLTVKVFSCGCILIVLIGVIFFLFNYLLGS